MLTFATEKQYLRNIMCKKNICKKGFMSRRQNRTGSRKRYANPVAMAQVGEKPIPVLTGKSAVCFLMKASKVEEEMNNSGTFKKPSDLKVFKDYAESVAAMEAESQKMKF